MFVLIIHASSSPVLIINRGINFINRGSIIILFDSKVSQLIALPAVIDITPNSKVGKMIFIFSLMWINAFDRLGPHKTINLKRIE